MLNLMKTGKVETHGNCDKTKYELRVVNWGKLSKLTCSFRFLYEPPFCRVKDPTSLWVWEGTSHMRV